MNKISIRTRLVLLVAALLALLTTASGFAVLRLSQANASIETIYNDRVVSLGQLKGVSDGNAVNIIETAQKVRDGIIPAAEGIKRITDARSRIGRDWRNYSATYLTNREKQLVSEATPLMDRSDAAAARLLELLRSNDAESLRAFVANDMYPAFDPLLVVLGQLVQLQMDVAQREYVKSHEAYQRARWGNSIVTVFVLAAATMVCWLLIRSIVRPLAEAVRVAETVAAGDLTYRIDVTGRDETSQLLGALKQMNGSLVEIVGGVRASGESIGAATKQIAAGNIDLSSRTEEQAASLEETAASMEELTGTVRQNAENARQASALASSAADIANRGNDAVARVIGTMGEISESSTKIAAIIALIEGIAFQTNILALNAAVEAARAGEQGRGFAVVAGEVRVLAQRSSSAAKEIKALIETSVARVATGTELVNQAGSTMHEINNAVSRVTSIMGEIAAASGEQSKGIDQVGHAITQMDDVTQQNAALVEQAAAAAQSLEDQATRLNAAVATFKLNTDARAVVHSPLGPVVSGRESGAYRRALDSRCQTT
ncbi:methyl-accepting chemotaxis protein/methyl-accepting chemotaxis protein-1 (serine sensor receptor) [Paraburkholderia sp. BL23I1N1]|uniref:methyl-accepting chemotaxis protein n=1 Tax=Paraburkholderia sp. BL23I1N1 TaxID=1938802 RepID=UPI000E75156D|nr:methyl-accepting chemotaxis protein [Paraburkholderia sp. BL23I1N1]RKE39429.1 methyl-accepting chemotaxis protein/methyl-accepting chemotaxis protein-1 (serine sensor receptor) [Paraburkholderia sp. BL23I1N1]